MRRIMIMIMMIVMVIRIWPSSSRVGYDNDVNNGFIEDEDNHDEIGDDHGHHHHHHHYHHHHQRQSPIAKTSSVMQSSGAPPSLHRCMPPSNTLAFICSIFVHMQCSISVYMYIVHVQCTVQLEIKCKFLNMRKSPILHILELCNLYLHN